MFFAIKENDVTIVKNILEAGRDPNHHNNNDRICTTPLHAAVKYKNISMVKCLIKAGANINKKNLEQQTPLQLAIIHSQNEIANFILNLNYDLNIEYEFETCLYLAIARENISIVREILRKTDHSEINGRILHHAIEYGKKDMVEILLESDRLDKNFIFNNLTPLLASIQVEKYDIAQLLIENGCLLTQKDQDKRNALHLAIEKGQTELVKNLLEAGINPNSKFRHWKPMHLAVYYNKLDIITILHKYKVSLDTQDSKHGNTPLHLAVKKKQVKIVKKMLSLGCDINKKNRDGKTALYIAGEMRYYKMVQILIDYKADQSVLIDSSTILHLAFREEDLRLIDCLMCCTNPALGIKDGNRRSPIDIAFDNGLKKYSSYFKVFVTYLSEGSDIEKKFKSYAIKHSDYNLLALLLSRGYNDDPNKQLSKCIEEKEIDNIKCLLECGIEPNFIDLLNAVSGNSLSIVQLIAECEKISDTRNLLNYIGNGQNALYLAAKNNQIEIAEVLLQNGADPNISLNTLCSSNSTALHIAAQTDNYKMVKLLASYKANLEAINTFGETALFRAVSTKKLKSIRELLYLGANVNAKNHNGQTALYIGLHNGMGIGTIMMLLEAGAEISEKDMRKAKKLERLFSKDIVALLSEIGITVFDELTDSHNTVRTNYVPENTEGSYRNKEVDDLRMSLYNAINENNFKVVKDILSKYSNLLNAVVYERSPFLHLAISKGYMDIVNILIHHKADVNKKDNFGNTPIVLAVEKNNMGAIKILLNNKCDIFLINNEGDCPISKALKLKDATLLNYLFEAGASIECVDRIFTHKVWREVTNSFSKSAKEKMCDVFTARCKLYNKNGDNLLTLAVNLGSISFLKSILKDEYFRKIINNPHERTGDYILHKVLKHDEKTFKRIYWMLLSHNSIIKILEKTCNGETVLCKAIHEKKWRHVKFLIKYGANIDFICEETKMSCKVLLESSKEHKLDKLIKRSELGKTQLKNIPRLSHIILRFIRTSLLNPGYLEYLRSLKKKKKIPDRIFRGILLKGSNFKVEHLHSMTTNMITCAAGLLLIEVLKKDCERIEIVGL